MKIKIRQISYLITILSYVILVLFVIIGSINYIPRQGEDPNVVFHTISDIIDDNPTNTAVYLMFVTVYGFVKLTLITLSLLDVDILQSELIERRTGRVSKRVRRLFYMLSIITAILSIFQLFGMIILVFFPISQVYHEHMVVAAFTFGSAVFKSFFFLIRRKLIYQIFSFFYLINIVYMMCFLASVILFYFYRYGLIEYLLVFFILAENFLLVAEFYNLMFIFTIKLEDNDAVVSDEDGETQPLTNNLF
jgi:hypothetical protein